MSRYVLAVADDPRLFESAARVLLRDARFSAAGEAIHCDGRSAPLTNIYAIDMDPSEWQAWQPAGHGAQDNGVPDPIAMQTLLIEGRCPEWVAEIGRMLAAELDAPTWLIDAADVLWPAGQVEWADGLPYGPPMRDDLARLVDSDGAGDGAENELFEAANDPQFVQRETGQRRFHAQLRGRLRHLAADARGKSFE